MVLMVLTLKVKLIFLSFTPFEFNNFYLKNFLYNAIILRFLSEHFKRGDTVFPVCVRVCNI